MKFQILYVTNAVEKMKQEKKAFLSSYYSAETKG